jgi:hypothetical protein
MKFDEWWATLSPPERRVIGESNARFVWSEAMKKGTQMKFKKKPVIIEAAQFLPNDEAIERVMALASQGSRQVQVTRMPDGHCTMQITTLEGVMEASIGDWIIRGIQGEVYPCKPDIFNESYERVYE